MTGAQAIRPAHDSVEWTWAIGDGPDGKQNDVDYRGRIIRLKRVLAQLDRRGDARLADTWVLYGFGVAVRKDGTSSTRGTTGPIPLSPEIVARLVSHRWELDALQALRAYHEEAAQHTLTLLDERFPNRELRIVDNRPTRPTLVTDVHCPRCGSGPGHDCVKPNGSAAGTAHQARRHAYLTIVNAWGNRR